MRSPRQPPPGSGAFGEPAPHAGEAFGRGRAPLPSHGRRRRELAVVLLSLAVAVVAVVIGNEIVSRERALTGPAGPGVLSAACAAHSSPLPLASVEPDRLLALRAVLERALAPAAGRVYAWGTVTSSDVWLDNSPERAELESAAASARLSAGIEIREWTPDPQWGAAYRDDLGADAFQFASSAQAARFFAQASSPSCHRAGSGWRALRPAGARALAWINPDDNAEEDVFLLSGRSVFRVADVRPQSRRPAPTRAERAVGLVTVEALACGLSGASCPRPRAGGQAA